jgi:hypothetical protein
MIPNVTTMLRTHETNATRAESKNTGNMEIITTIIIAMRKSPKFVVAVVHPNRTASPIENLGSAMRYLALVQVGGVLRAD